VLLRELLQRDPRQRGAVPAVFRRGVLATAACSAHSEHFAQIRIEAGAENSKQAENPTVSLLAPYTEEAQLIKLLERISRLRKPPPVRRDVHKLEGGLRRSLIADIPILAKL
jgi:hypothetical protein